MRVLGSWLRICLAAGFVSLLAGCLPTAENQSEEQLEAHFQTGKSRINAMDFKGATESFERALEVNPQNASAHFELGWLFDQKEVDPASAIYHYHKYLKLRPKAGNAEMVRARVIACQQELASMVMLSPATQVLQKELQQAAEQNRVLREQLAACIQRLQVLTNTTPGAATGGAQIQRPSETVQLQPQTQTPTPRTPQNPTSTPTATQKRPAIVRAPQPEALSRPTTTTAPTRSRYHSVQPGETSATIARKYGITQARLLQANPRLDSGRVRVGQTLVIPGS